MITKEQYEAAVKQHNEAQKIIDQFHKERLEVFNQKIKAKTVWKGEELVFAAYNRCPCGYGLAYPKDCGFNHYWDCAGILMGVADKSVQHTEQLPFAFYEVKSESQPSANGATTRGTVVPQKNQEAQSDE